MNVNEQGPLERLLAFDTSTSSLAVAVMENGKLLAERNIYAERNHSVYLVTAIEEALAMAGITKKDLDAIAVGIGPGSYTGIRIAVTTAKTIAWVLNIPVFSVSSLEAIAIGGWAHGIGQDPVQLGLSMYKEQSDRDDVHAEQWIIPLVDARRGQVYTSLFMGTRDHMPTRVEQDGIRMMDNWSHELADKLTKMEMKDRPSAIWFVGETLPVHEKVAREILTPLGIELYFSTYELEGTWMGLVGTNVVLRGHSDDVHTLEPNYTQLAEAEVQVKARERAKLQANAGANAGVNVGGSEKSNANETSLRNG